MLPASMRPVTWLAIALVPGQIATARAEDLPPELVARPATLPHGVVALTLTGGYDSAHVLGIPVLSATTLGVLLQRGMTSRLELSLGSGLAVHPDAQAIDALASSAGPASAFERHFLAAGNGSVTTSKAPLLGSHT